MARAMSETAWRAFVQHGTRTGKLATVRPDGRPHVAPIWFVLDEETGELVFNTGADTAKGKALRRDPRASLCVDDERPPFAFVVIEGTVTLSDDVDAMLPWSTRIGARYMGPERGEELGRRNAVPGELLVRLHPTKVVAFDDIAGY